MSHLLPSQEENAQMVPCFVKTRDVFKQRQSAWLCIPNIFHHTALWNIYRLLYTSKVYASLTCPVFKWKRNMLCFIRSGAYSSVWQNTAGINNIRNIQPSSFIVSSTHILIGRHTHATQTSLSLSPLIQDYQPCHVSLCLMTSSVLYISETVQIHNHLDW